MDIFLLQLSIGGLITLGLITLLYSCWCAVDLIVKVFRYIKRRIKHEPEPQEWYFLAYTCKKEGITTTCSAHIGINRKKLKTSDFESIEAELKEMNEADYIVITSITHLGKE